ncbi:MAG: hypothetical protein CMP63_04065 [Flavobacteriales bacterium]|nr:hypothetical protein [Flavobacteriales bacterium]
MLYIVNIIILQKMKAIFFISFLFCILTGFGQKEYKYTEVKKNAARIEFLNLSNEEFTELPSIIETCKNLKKLKLNNNRLTFLPDWLKKIESIEELDISGNRTLNINQAFSVISQLPNLKKLVANHCNMFYLPVAIRRIETLKEVSISDNHIKYLPPIFEYTFWEKLDLSYNCIDTLPSTLVFMNTLKSLDLSYTPAIENKFTYYTVEFLKNLKTLKLSGANFLPKEIYKIDFIKELVLTNGTFERLPEEFEKIKNLKKLDIRGCENLKISDLVELLTGSYSTLRDLKIGHKFLNTIPYNISKLKKINSLTIDNSCLEKLSSSIARFRGKDISFKGCRFPSPSDVFKEIGKSKKIKRIYINNCVFGKSDWKIGASDKFEEIHIRNCYLTYLPLNIEDFPKLKLLNLSGNKIAKNKITWKTPKTILGADYQTLSYEAKELNNWKYVQNQKTIKRMIYTEVGDLFTLPSGAKVEVPAECFIGTGNTTIIGNVKLEIKEFRTQADYAYTKYPTYLPNGDVSDTKYAIEIRAFCKNKEVFVKSEKPILIFPQFKKEYALDKYFYLEYKSKWQTLNQNTNICINNSESQIIPKCMDYSNIPKIGQDLKVSKVFVKLMRKKKKKKLNFEITPEYGYRDQLLNPFGDKIKGYPELKHYKGIKWRYVGDSLEKDLKKLYFLSDEAKIEKLKKYSSLKAYVLDIKDIRIYPNPNDDNYLIQFIQGRDTFSIEALPFITVYKAKKIQRWHRVKYRKYKKSLEKRKEKWRKMDTTFINHYEKFEAHLEAFRIYNLKALYSINKQNNNKKPVQTLKIYKPGLYQMAIPLLLNKGELKKPVYYIKGKRFYPKKVLVSNISKGYNFWSDPKDIPKEKGIYKISTVLDDILYSGTWGINNKVTFEKVTTK